MKLLMKWVMLGAAATLGAAPAGAADASVYLTEVPDYAWYFGCMPTASGNLMGFWDRHGFPDFYTGPANGGVAPLDNNGNPSDPPGTSHYGIVSMWASRAGVDGRPANQPGHVDDYYVGYDSAAPDPYVTAHRAEHAPDCLADFIGASQLKWTNMANECNGNIDGFCFNYWDASGEPRTNFVPSGAAGLPPRDVQSGLRAWTRFRGYDCTVISQLTVFNPHTPSGKGFTFADMQAEIDAGYPVLLFLQSYNQTSSTVGLVPNVNPEIHSMLAYGYYVNAGVSYVRYRTSWAEGDKLSVWGPQNWQANMPVRGVIRYHPLPRIRQWQYSAASSSLTLQWDGPAAILYDQVQGTTRPAQGFVVEMSPSLWPPAFAALSPVLTTNTFSIANCPAPALFRVKVVKP